MRLHIWGGVYILGKVEENMGISWRINCKVSSEGVDSFVLFLTRFYEDEAKEPGATRSLVYDFG